MESKKLIFNSQVEGVNLFMKLYPQEMIAIILEAIKYKGGEDDRSLRDVFNSITSVFENGNLYDHYNSFIHAHTSYENMYQDIFRILEESDNDYLNGDYICKIADLKDIFFDRHLFNGFSVSTVNVDGRDITMCNYGDYKFPICKTSDADLKYFGYQDKVYEIVLDVHPSTMLMEFRRSITKYLGSTFASKFSSVPKDSKDLLTFVHNSPEDFNSIRGVNAKGKLVSMKLSRYMAKFPDIFSQKDLEDAAAFMKADRELTVKIVEGEEIAECYHEHNYVDCVNSGGSTLHNSCMRYYEKSRMTDLYVKNPEQIKLLVAYKHDKVTARALLWYTDQGSVVMDRVYYHTESDMSFMVSQAIQNGWYYKSNQNAYSQRNFSFKGNPMKSMTFTITPKNLDGINHYPYMDTFKYFSLEDKCLKNVPIGVALVNLEDQYGRVPFGIAAKDPQNNVITNSDSSQISLGKYWPMEYYDDYPSRLEEFDSRKVIRYSGTTLKATIHNKSNYPFRVSGSPSEDPTHVICTQSGIIYADVPCLEYLEAGDKIAYSSVDDKITFVAKNLYFTEPSKLSPQDIAKNISNGVDVFCILSYDNLLRYLRNHPNKSSSLGFGNYYLLNLTTGFINVSFYELRTGTLVDVESALNFLSEVSEQYNSYILGDINKDDYHWMMQEYSDYVDVTEEEEYSDIDMEFSGLEFVTIE